MRILVAIAVLLLPGGVAQAQRPSSLRDLRRNVALEQAVRARLSSQAAVLQLRVKVRLADARKAVTARLATAPDASGAYTIAFEEVTRQFSFLTGPQADLLSFYVLADLANILESDMDSRDFLADLDAETALRLRLYMDERSTFVTVLGNLLKRTADISQQLAQNIK